MLTIVSSPGNWRPPGNIIANASKAILENTETLSGLHGAKAPRNDDMGHGNLSPLSHKHLKAGDPDVGNDD
jgi:hypothetical protein